jgi:Na+/proline symporter
MTKYNTFLCFFIIAVVAMIVFFVFYLQAIFGFAFNLHDMERGHPNPFEFFSRLFTPQVIISGMVMGIASLTYRILGIVHVAKNKTAKDGEKALWIVGFIIMGFVTAIVFLVMAKGRKFVD